MHFGHFESKNLATLLVACTFCDGYALIRERLINLGMIAHDLYFIDSCFLRELLQKRELMRFRLYLVFWTCFEVCALIQEGVAM